MIQCEILLGFQKTLRYINSLATPECRFQQVNKLLRFINFPRVFLFRSAHSSPEYHAIFFVLRKFLFRNANVNTRG